MERTLLRLTCIAHQVDSAENFASRQDLKDADILCVFQVLQTAALGQKARRRPQMDDAGLPLFYQLGVTTNLPPSAFFAAWIASSASSRW